jgi:hypothetical protein
MKSETGRATPGPFSGAEPYKSYEAMLVRLHELDRVGALDSAEADLVRDRMDESWARLSLFERERLACLSADLTLALLSRAPAINSSETADKFIHDGNHDTSDGSHRFNSKTLTA